MKTEDKARFKTVAVPINTYNILKDLAVLRDRSLARQLKVIVDEYQQNGSSS